MATLNSINEYSRLCRGMVISVLDCLSAIGRNPEEVPPVQDKQPVCPGLAMSAGEGSDLIPGQVRVIVGDSVHISADTATPLLLP